MIYLDVNATTPLDPKVVDSITAALTEGWANPSSGYPMGVKARAIVTNARKSVAAMIGASSSEVIFTSGGTEANHLAIWSAFPAAHRREERPHVITSEIEHDAVTKPLRRMEEEGKIDLTVLSINPATGAVRPEAVTSALRQSTCLVTLMHANNETGAIQPISEISARINSWNESLPTSSPPVLFHTDAAQAVGKVPVDVRELGCDYLSIVGHKFYGPRIGALFVRSSAPFRHLFLGGGQEGGRRAGTENTPMIAGLGMACALVTENQQQYSVHFARMRQALEEGLVTALGDARLRFNSRLPCVLPNTCSVAFLGMKASGRDILAKCPQIAASVGAACHSGSCKPSQILLASGVPFEAARCTLRLSVGRQTSLEDIEKVVRSISSAVEDILQEEAAES